MIDACGELKLLSADLHKRAESTAFIQKLLRCKAGRENYLTYLRALSIVHAVLERSVSTSEHGLLKNIWREEMRKLPLLERDIEIIGQGHSKDLTAPILAALKVAENIRSLSLQNTNRLVGYLYVLEGSTNGGTHIYPRVTQAFGLSGDAGVKYLKNYGEAQPKSWQRFKERLNAVVLNEKVLDEVVQGVHELYEGLIAILEACDEAAPSIRVHVTSINPEAGNHRVPQSELELKAVMIAADASLEELPYVRARYGVRGERYTKSDGAWLATLPELPFGVVVKQVNWLGKFLSQLGMPRFALELHLRETEKALSSVFPGQESKYHVLSDSAALLGVQRDQIIPSLIQIEVKTQFISKLKPEEISLYKNLAEILISAVADECMDHSGALNKTLDWIATASHWPAPVVGACHALVDELKPHCNGLES